MVVDLLDGCVKELSSCLESVSLVVGKTAPIMIEIRGAVDLALNKSCVSERMKKELLGKLRA